MVERRTGEAVAGGGATRPRRTLILIGILAALTATAVSLHAWYEFRNHFFDLMVYRDAMRWWDGGGFLYDFSRPDGTQGQLQFTYPPFAAYLLRPLAWFTQTQAAWVSTAIGVAALAVAVWLLIRPLADRYSWPRWFAFGCAFVLASGLEPIRHTVDFGQINFVLWVLVLVDLLILQPRGSRFTGVGIGLAAAIKLVPGIFILYLLAARRWRAAAVAAATTAAATGLAAAFAPRESWVYFTERLPHSAGVGKADYTFNQSLLGVLARLATPAEPSRAVWLVLAAAALGYGLWRAGRAAVDGDEVAGLTLAGLTGCLISPVTWGHHIFWFVPALVVLTDASLRVRQGQAVRGPLRAWAALAAYAAVVYVTVTVSVLSWWDFILNNPGGLAGFLLSNWFVWLMISLLVLLPARPAFDAPAGSQGRRVGTGVRSP